MAEQFEKSVGEQLSSDALNKRQRDIQNSVIGPVVVGVGVADGANIGRILRLTDALNCREVIFVDTPHVDSQRIRKVSRGMSDKRPHRFMESVEFMAEIENYDPLIAVEITSQSLDLFACNLPLEATFVIGNERHGIPDEFLNLCQFAIHIPMFGINSSMNVATSLSIVLYEWYRRFYV